MNKNDKIIKVRKTESLLYEFPIEIIFKKTDWERLSPEIMRNCTLIEQDDFNVRVHFWGIAQTPIINLDLKKDEK